MSESAPGYPDPVAFVAPERARLAAALRAAIDAAMTTPEADPDMLVAVAEQIEGATRLLVGPGPGASGPGYRPRSHDDYLPRSPVVGGASPISPGTFDWEVVADPADPERRRVVATSEIPSAYEGPPGYVHGGIVALCFDELLGMVNIVNGCPGMTGTLSVRYRRPTPLFQPLRWESWVERIDGRRVQARAQVSHGDTLCAEAEGLFIAPRPERRAEYFPDAPPEGSGTA